MSRRGIGEIGKPPMRFRVDLASNAIGRGFETLDKSRREDLLRAKRVRKSLKKHPEMFDRKAALALATKLEQAGEGGETPRSIASSVYMRGLRINVVGAVWQMIRKAGTKKVRAFTIVPRTWEFSGEKLDGVDPKHLMRGLLVALYGRGAAMANGWIFAVLHGEWDPIGQVYRIHVHGFAYGEMVAVIDRLRTLPNYATQRYLKDGSLSPVYRRVRVTREKLTNLPEPITYRLQSYWPAKALFISDDGARRRARRKGRIAEPHHSQVLLWLDRWSISDLTLMVGLRLTKTGLTQTKPVS